MIETCKSCGTVFEVDESILTKNVQWFKCGVCNNKWILSSNTSENSNLNKTEFKNKSDKLKHELASIKSVVEDKSKKLAEKTNPVLSQKNKSVAEIASELSLSKLNESNKNKRQNLENRNTKKISKNVNLFPFFVILTVLIISSGVFFRSLLIGYSYLYFPKYSEIFAEEINKLLTKIDLPILSETKYLTLINFVATVKKQEVRFTGVIKNNYNRPILMPRIKILGIREDRKIILEKTLILDEKVIPPNLEISFSKLVKLKTNNKKENITIKATLLKNFFDY